MKLEIAFEKRTTTPSLTAATHGRGSAIDFSDKVVLMSLVLRVNLDDVPERVALLEVLRLVWTDRPEGFRRPMDSAALYIWERVARSLGEELGQVTGWVEIDVLERVRSRAREHLADAEFGPGMRSHFGRIARGTDRRVERQTLQAFAGALDRVTSGEGLTADAARVIAARSAAQV